MGEGRTEGGQLCRRGLCLLTVSERHDGFTSSRKAEPRTQPESSSSGSSPNLSERRTERGREDAASCLHSERVGVLQVLKAPPPAPWAVFRDTGSESASDPVKPGEVCRLI